jgi:hypothetical protein
VVDFERRTSTVSLALLSATQAREAVPTSSVLLADLRALAREPMTFEFAPGRARYRPETADAVWRTMPVADGLAHPLDPLWGLDALERGVVLGIERHGDTHIGPVPVRYLRAWLDLTPQGWQRRVVELPASGIAGVATRLRRHWRRFPVDTWVDEGGRICQTAHAASTATGPDGPSMRYTARFEALA